MEPPDTQERLHAAAQVVAMVLFVPLALIAALAAMLLLMLVGFGFAFSDGPSPFGIWAIFALVIAIGAIGGMNHPTRSALLRYLVLSAVTLPGRWLVRSD